MSKLKLLMLIILVVVLVDFAVENAQPAQAFKLFKFQLGVLPHFLVVYFSLVVGMVVGWFAHGLKIRRKRREAKAAQDALDQQKQKSQAGQDSYQTQ
jgi:uncharacterized integral membrane protein